MQQFLVVSVGLSLCYSITLLFAPVIVDGTFNVKGLVIGLATAGASIAIFCTVTATH